MTEPTRGFATIDVSRLREGLRDVLDEVVENGKRRIVTRHGKPVAALVPLGDLRALEAGDRAAVAALRSEARLALPTAGVLPIEEAMARLRADSRRVEPTVEAGADVEPRPGTTAPSETDEPREVLRRIVAELDEHGSRDRVVDELVRAVRAIAACILGEAEAGRKPLAKWTIEAPPTSSRNYMVPDIR